MDRMRVRVTVRVDMGSDRKAESLLESITPDNVDMPRGMSIDVDRDGGTLLVSVEHDMEKLDTLTATVDEVMEHISLTDRLLNDRDGD